MNESRKHEPRRPDCVTEVRMGNADPDTFMAGSGGHHQSRR